MIYFLILIFITSTSVFAKGPITEQKEDVKKRKEWMQSTYENTNVANPQMFKQRQETFSASLPNASEGVFTKGSQISSQTWMHAGPKNIGGRTRAVAYDKTNPNIIIAGGISGGIWRSVDGGQSWVQITGIHEVASVSSIIQDPRLGRNNEWYCAGGETQGNSASMFFSAYYGGNGILKSTDNGITWKPYGTTTNNSPQVNETIDYVYRLAIDPTNLDEDILYAAGVLNILRISDNGNKIESALDLDGFLPVNLYSDIMITPSGKFYATLSTMAYIGNVTHQGIFYSEDGKHWVDISPDFLQPTLRIVMDYAQSDENLVYFFSQNIKEYSTGCDERYPECYSIFKLDNTDGKKEWTNLSENIPFFDSKQGFNYIGTQNGYCMAINVSPIDPNIVVLAGANCFISYDGFTSQDRIQWVAGYRPDYDSKTFDYKTQRVEYFKYSLKYHFENGSGWDFHLFVFNPDKPNEMISASDRGLQKLNDVSENAEKNWIDLNNGYCTTQVYACAINKYDASDNTIFAGFQDNNTLACFDESMHFDKYCSGDGFESYITKYGSVIVSAQENYIVRLDLDKSEIIGLSYISTGDYSIPNPPFTTAYAVEPKEEKEMVIATNTAIGICYDITTDDIFGTLVVTNIDQLAATTVEFGQTENKLVLIGTKNKNKNIYKITDYSEENLEYEVINLPEYVTGYYISDIWTDPTDNDHFIAIVSNYLTLGMLETKDGGNTWTDNGGNLEEFPDGTGAGSSFRCYERIVYNNDTLHFLGTSDGLFSTKNLDGANTVWMREGANTIGKAVIADIEVRELDGRIVVATHGNGLFKTNYSTSVEEFDGSNLGFAVSEVFPNPASSYINFVINSDKASYIDAKLLDLNGKEVANIAKEEFTGTKTIEYNISSLAAGTYFLHISNGNSFITKKVNVVR